MLVDVIYAAFDLFLDFILLRHLHKEENRKPARQEAESRRQEAKLRRERAPERAAQRA